MSASTSTAPLAAGSWFREESSMWPGQGMSLRVADVMVDKQTDFQHLVVFKNDGPWGTVMLLDGAIQLTDKDEFVYHEMMAHVPLSAHPNPQRVLIIGGGDGGVLREVLRHESVTSCHLVDIDGGVIEAAKAHFPRVAFGFSDPRARVTVGDGARFVAEAADASFDVVIIDSSDPEGPASALFGEEFYRHVTRVLTPDGIVCAQGESAWLHMSLIEKMLGFFRGSSVGFASAKYGMIYIPTYPGGSIGCLVGAKSAATDVTKPARALAFEGSLQYYDSAVHTAAFALPRFAQHLNKV